MEGGECTMKTCYHGGHEEDSHLCKGHLRQQGGAKGDRMNAYVP